MEKSLDIVLFGATGYTGKNAIAQVHKLAKNLTWGIAGRNEVKLKKVLSEVAQQINVDFTSVPIVLADVEDEDSIKKMTAKAKIIINCCGPFDIYGEVVVKSCVETGTHYVDVSGEIQFINRMLAKYDDLAQKAGVYIISACGYDSIPVDLGICFIENNFSGTINSLETFMSWYEEGGNTPGAMGNVGSWESIVNYMASFPKIILKKNENTIKRPSFKPQLRMKLLSKIDDGWACLFPTADVDLVYRSQQFFYEHENKRPIQIYNYALIPYFKHVVLGLILLIIIGILGLFKFGRSILLQYPEFFTNGLISNQLSEEKMKRMRFSIKFKCQGWSEKLSNTTDQYETAPNKEIVGRVSGSNPGYGFTTLAATLSALMVLTEKHKLPPKGGVYTPAIAFSKTSLVQQLQNNGVVFEVISIKDIP